MWKETGRQHALYFMVDCVFDSYLKAWDWFKTILMDQLHCGWKYIFSARALDLCNATPIYMLMDFLKTNGILEILLVKIRAELLLKNIFN